MFARSQDMSSKKEDSKVLVANFRLPYHLGEIRDHYKGESDKFIVHVQDAHCNKFAQKQIAKIIEHYYKETQDRYCQP